LIAFMAATAQARAEGQHDDASAGLPVPQLLDPKTWFREYIDQFCELW
jgi:hypothetical protein